VTDISSPSHPPFAPPSSSDTPALLAVPPLLPRAKPFRVSIRPPGSKSLTNRALLLAALARGDSVIRRPLLEADDAQRMIAAVTTLGAKVTRSGQDLKITGVNGRWVVPPEGVTLDLGNAGTATRFLAAAALLAPGPVTVDGNARMRQRPIAELAGALIHLHANIEFTGTKGCPPMKIVPPRGPAGEARALVLPTTMSSQFISALLLVAPWLAHDVTIKLVGEITSASYITMTIGLLQKLGAHVQMTEDLRGPRADDGRFAGDTSWAAACGGRALARVRARFVHVRHGAGRERGHILLGRGRADPGRGVQGSRIGTGVIARRRGVPRVARADGREQ